MTSKTSAPSPLRRAAAAADARLGFASVPLTGADALAVAPGYTARVLFAWGDPVSDGPRWNPQALDSSEAQELQAGMHHDGMEFFPLPRGSRSSERGLLAVNHESVDPGLLFRDGFAGWSAEKLIGLSRSALSACAGAATNATAAHAASRARSAAATRRVISQCPGVRTCR